LDELAGKGNTRWIEEVKLRNSKNPLDKVIGISCDRYIM